MRNEDGGRGGKREKSHEDKKSYGGHLANVKRKQIRNAARPKQRFLGVDKETGLGLGWARP